MPASLLSAEVSKDMNLFSRRTILTQTTGLAKAVAAAGAMAAIAPLLKGRGGRAQTKRPVKVIVTGGHPGDPEYGCGGTIARYTALGHAAKSFFFT